MKCSIFGKLFLYDSKGHFSSTKRANNFHYYTVYPLSLFSLAKSIQLVLEISATYRLFANQLTD